MAATGEWTKKEGSLTITLPIYADDVEAMTEEAERCRLAALAARTTFPPDYASRGEASFMDPWSYEPPDRGGEGMTRQVKLP